jgi:glucose dehydrogenase
VRRIISPSSAAAGLAWLGMVAFLSPPAGVAARQRAQSKTAATVEWKTYGADLASTRYSPHDQIDKANFSKLKIAWRLTTNDFGPRPDTLYSATPLFVGNVLYTTVGTTRTVVALNPTMGAVLWKHVGDEGREAITAYDMKTGDILWQKTHSSTPDDIKNNPALQGVNLPPRLGQPGRTFIGTLTTKTLVIAGEGGVHRNEAGERVALLRAYDKVTGADIGAVEMPDKQTGSPMTYMINGKQYIVVAVSGVDGAQLIAYALP